MDSAKLMEEMLKTLPSKVARLAKSKMMQDSPKAESVPPFLYHGSFDNNHKSILNKGIIANKVFGEVYLCETEEQVLAFIETPCVIYKINTSKLNRGLFRMSLDHNRENYPFDVFSYYNDVPKKAIVSHSTHN